MCGELHARLQFGRTDDIMRFGLHEYLIDFLERGRALDDEITRRFLVPDLLMGRADVAACVG